MQRPPRGEMEGGLRWRNARSRELGFVILWIIAVGGESRHNWGADGRKGSRSEFSSRLLSLAKSMCAHVSNIPGRLLPPSDMRKRWRARNGDARRWQRGDVRWEEVGVGGLCGRWNKGGKKWRARGHRLSRAPPLPASACKSAGSSRLQWGRK